jgi:hypothetical protein
VEAHAGADAAMTAERQETKYVVPHARAQALVQVLTQRLRRHRFTGEGANPLPQPRHYVTTIYFDTPSRQLFRAAVASDSNLKLRAKEYYDLHPHLVETATDARQLVRFRPALWLEIKHKEGTRTGKRRLGIPKRDVPGFFGRGVVTPEMLRIQERVYGAEAEQVLREVAALCGRLDEPLQADSLVNYRRVAWQDDAGTVRVTIDLGIAFFAPPADLWQRQYALVRETLGEPGAVERRCVLEIKMRGEPPPWLPTVLAGCGAVREPYSKFESASRAVHG